MSITLLYYVVVKNNTFFWIRQFNCILLFMYR